MAAKHIVIDARIRQASTGRPVDKLLGNLQKLDSENKYTVYVAKDDEWQPEAKNFKAVKCRFRNFSLNPFNQLLFSEWLYKLKPDLVHFTLTGQQPLFYLGKQITFTHDLTMFKFARAGRLPKVVHGFRMMCYRLLVWAAHKKAVVTLVPTIYVQDAVNKKYLFTNRKTVVTYEAAEPLPKAKAQPPVENLEDFIMYTGSAFEHKNLKRLVLAFIKLKEKNPTLKLVLVGRLEYHAKKLKHWAQNQPHAKDFIFTGFVSDAQLRWLYEHAAAYIFPSLSEGFGLPGLEAMVHGCPVVSSNATCLPEVYGDAAEYFDPKDIDEMADAINRVIKNESLRDKLIKDGKNQAAKYSWEKMARETLEVYKQVLG